MKTKPYHWRGLAALAIILNTLGTGAQEAPREPSGAEKVQMINAARVDLYAQLAREIKGLNISESSIVADAVTLETIRSGFVDAIVRGVVEGEPVFVGDVCLIDGSITLDQVVENLARITTTRNNEPTANFESIKRYNNLTVVKAKGSGTLAAPGNNAPSRAALADDGLAYTISQLEGPGQHKLNAIEAARLDAYARLAGKLKGMHITDRTTLYNSTQSRWTEAATSALIKGARIKRYFPLGKDAVVCEMEITLEQIVENIHKHSTIFADGHEVSQETVRRVNGELHTVKAFGTGAVNSGQPAGQAPSARGIIGSVQ